MAEVQQHQADDVSPQGKENLGQILSKPAAATGQLMQPSESAKREQRSLASSQQPRDATADLTTKRMSSFSQTRPGRLVKPQQQHMSTAAGAQTRQPSFQQQSKAAVRLAGSLSTAPLLQRNGQLHISAGASPAAGDSMAAEVENNARHTLGRVHGSHFQTDMQAPASAAQTNAAHRPNLSHRHVTGQASDRAADRKEGQDFRQGSRRSSLSGCAGPQQPSYTTTAPSDPAQRNAAKRQGAAAATGDNPDAHSHNAAACRNMPADQHKGSRGQIRRPALGMPPGHPGRHRGQRLQGSTRGRGSRPPSVAGGRSNAAMSLPGNAKRSKVGSCSRKVHTDVVVSTRH